MLNEEAENRYYNRIRRRITDIRRRHIYYSYRKSRTDDVICESATLSNIK